MAQSRRGFSRSSRQSSRRLTEWSQGPGGTGPTVVSTPVATIIGAILVPTAPGLTVVRIRGELEMHLSLATAALDGFAGAFGIGIATAAAATAGGASVPTPITEEDSDNWLYHRYFSVKAPIASAVSTAPTGEVISANVRIEVDSKAMRKFPLEMALYASLEVVEVGTAIMQVAFNSRALVKLS